MGNLLSQTSQSVSTTEVPINPQQDFWEFDELTFDTRFDTGSLMNVDQVSSGWYNIWVAPDCFKTQYECVQRSVFFHFKCVPKVQIQQNKRFRVKFQIVNMQKQKLAMYKRGLLPVYCGPSTGGKWKYLPYPLESYQTVEYNDVKKTQIVWTYDFSALDISGVSFAFTFPYSYQDCQNLCNYLEQSLFYDSDIYFHRELIHTSQEGRRIDLMTITAQDPEMMADVNKEYETEPYLPNLFPEKKDSKTPKNSLNKKDHRPFIFKNRKYVFFTARCHPGESHGSFMLQSFLLGLINKADNVSKELLKTCVFVIIPMLNPDGVYKGFQRLDPLGENWNSIYHIADPKLHAGPYASMEVAKNMASRMILFIDWHSHANKHSGFTYCRWSADIDEKTDIRTFVRMIDIYSKHFDLNSCGSAPAPKNKKKSGVSKGEIGRVTNCLHCYTLECGYHVGKKDPDRYDPIKNPKQDLKREVPHVLGIDEYLEIGNGTRLALADFLGVHPDSMLPKTFYGDIKTMREAIKKSLQAGTLEEEQEDNSN